MKTARLIAHIASRCETSDETRSGHDGVCDDVTAAIEARDAEWQAALDVAMGALEEIAEYDTDFAKGPADNVGALQTISERALSQISKLTQVPRG